LEKINNLQRSSSAFDIREKNSNSNNINNILGRGSMITMKNGSTNNFIKKNDVKQINNHLSKNKFEDNNNKNNISNDLNELSRSLSNYSFNKSRIQIIKQFSSSRNSLLKITKNQKIIEELDTSRIETLFDDDKLTSIENVGKKLMDLIIDFAERYKGKFELNPEDYTYNGLVKLKESLFYILETYYETFDKSISLNNILKSYLLSYSENFRTINKKINRLNELKETLSVKAEFSDNFYREDNKCINNIIDIIRKEILIYKQIFNLKYNKDNEDLYKKELNSNKCNYLIIYVIFE
jgi:hypothetical protein